MSCHCCYKTVTERVRCFTCWIFHKLIAHVIFSFSTLFKFHHHSCSTTSRCETHPSVSSLQDVGERIMYHGHTPTSQLHFELRVQIPQSNGNVVSLSSWSNTGMAYAAGSTTTCWAHLQSIQLVLPSLCQTLSQITVTYAALWCQPNSRQTSLEGQSGATGILRQTPRLGYFLWSRQTTIFHLQRLNLNPVWVKRNASFSWIAHWANPLSCIYHAICNFPVHPVKHELSSTLNPCNCHPLNPEDGLWCYP